jgi:hypothetical protein
MIQFLFFLFVAILPWLFELWIGDPSATHALGTAIWYLFRCVLTLYLAVGLWQLQNVARVCAIIYQCTLFLFMLYGVRHLLPLVFVHNTGNSYHTLGLLSLGAHLFSHLVTTVPIIWFLKKHHAAFVKSSAAT